MPRYDKAATSVASTELSRQSFAMLSGALQEQMFRNAVKLIPQNRNGKDANLDLVNVGFEQVATWCDKNIEGFWTITPDRILFEHREEMLMFLIAHPTVSYLIKANF